MKVTKRVQFGAFLRDDECGSHFKKRENRIIQFGYRRTSDRDRAKTDRTISKYQNKNRFFFLEEFGLALYTI